MPLINSNSSSFKVIITLVSQIWTAVVAILFTPIYLRLIGVESYGLVAFFTTLISSLAILDLGLSTSASRQLSLMRAIGNTLQEQRSLLISIETIYWGLAVLLGLGIVGLSYPIAIYWVNSKDLPTSVIQKAVMLMGVAFSFQWPNSIYTGSLTGLQKQTQSAIISILYATFRAATMYLSLRYISPTIECFFIVQIVMTFLQVGTYRLVTWHQLRLPGHRARFSKTQLHNIKRFAAGVTGISLVSFALTQIDKIIVSKLVLLEYVGYYNLAFVLANIMITIITPMQTVFFPKFSSLAASGQEDQLAALFKKTARWVSIIVIPIGSFFVFFSKEILYLWTKNAVLAENTGPILRFAAIGTACNCLMYVPYFFMLSKGITRFTIYQNIIASIILTPLLFWWTSKYGAVGASLVWFTVNLGYLLISLPLFHHFYFRGHLQQWYINNLFKPALIAIPLVYLFKLAMQNINIQYNYFSFGLMLIVLSIIYSLMTKEIRILLAGIYVKRFKL